jgi:hypothetical protein
MERVKGVFAFPILMPLFKEVVTGQAGAHTLAKPAAHFNGGQVLPAAGFVHSGSRKLDYHPRRFPRRLGGQVNGQPAAGGDFHGLFDGHSSSGYSTV